jgi:hypothetical protein
VVDNPRDGQGQIRVASYYYGCFITDHDGSSKRQVTKIAVSKANESASENSPWNFKNLLLLHQAELHSIQKDNNAATPLHNEAIEASSKSTFVHEETL